MGRWQGERLPDVDLLLSSLTVVAPGELAVSLRVDDESTTAPTTVKSVLTVVLVLALLATVVLLALVDRRVRRPGLRWPRRPGLGALVDLVVVAVLVWWTFVAPATDDDGYFVLQARNAALTGSVGDYVQFQNRGFTPFTWPYLALAEWQQWVGTAPVLLRVPAAVCGVSPGSRCAGSAAAARSCGSPRPWRSSRGGSRTTWGSGPSRWWPCARPRRRRCCSGRRRAVGSRSPGSPWPSPGRAASRTPAAWCCWVC